MTYPDDCTLPNQFLEQLAQEGLEGPPEMIRILVNEAMQLERQKHLKAVPFERSPERRGQANRKALDQILQKRCCTISTLNFSL